MIKYSVIIPAYNSEKTIALCLDSILNQSISIENYEVIVVDDGSIDNMANIVTQYDKVKLIRQRNQGPATARNLGAKEAQGEFILFTDSDCELEKNWLEEMVRPFTDEQIGGVQGRYKTKQKRVIALLDQIDIEGRYHKMMKRKYIDSIGTYSAAYRRDVFNKLGGFNTNYKTACGEDIEFSFLLSKSGYKMIFAERAICYHKHPDTLYKYLRTKYSRGYWRTLLYKNNRDKIIQDSYTSLIMKVQYMLVIFALLSLFSALIIDVFIWVASVCIILFFILCTPFMLFALKKNFKVTLIYPFICFFRAIFFITGMSLGLVHVLTGKIK